MWNMLRAILSVAFLAVCAAADPSAAQHSQAWNACAGKDGAPRELAISGCALVVQSGKATKQQLEAAYSKLCAFSAAEFYSPRAFQDCDNLIARDPKLAWAWLLRGRASWAKGDHERAIADLNEAICLDPKDHHAYRASCFVRAIIDQPQQGLSDCNEALRLKPDDPATLTTRGFVHLKLAQHDLAIADFDAALRLEPRQVDLLYLRGLAKLRKGDSEGGSADAAAAKAIRSNVVRQYARYGLAE